MIQQDEPLSAPQAKPGRVTQLPTRAPQLGRLGPLACTLRELVTAVVGPTRQGQSWHRRAM